MNFQEEFIKTMTPRQVEKWKREKLIVADFKEFKKCCDEAGETLNIAGVCRWLSSRHGVTTMTIRRALEENNLI